MKKLLRKVLIGLLLLQVTGCAVTVHRWNDITSLKRIENAPESEREAYYQEHAIKEIYNFLEYSQRRKGTEAFSTFAEPDTLYLYKDYTSDITALYPEAEQLLNEAKQLQEAQYITYSACSAVMVGSLISLWIALQPKDKSGEYIGTALLSAYFVNLANALTTVAFLGVFMEEENSKYLQIKEGYNEALRKRLDLSPDSLSQAIPEPTLAVK